jgi:hypothetical protein
MSFVLLVQIALTVLVPFGDQSMPAYALLPAVLAVYLVDECVVFPFTRGFATGAK